ncbi:MAG: hypothetical protein LBU89_00250 [Fibromonadaceae bacterium]|nr:hypothetical protein [Fibromonadaceae bacterium]
MRKKEKYQNEMSFEKAVNKLRELIGRGIILKNKKNGEEVRLSRRSIGKLLSNAAVAKSIANGFTRGQHYAAASDIDNLFVNSIKILTQPDKYKNLDIVAMHRFIAPLFGSNKVYITVKEAKEQGKRIYTIELIEMRKLEGILEEAKLNSANFPHF